MKALATAMILGALFGTYLALLGQTLYRCRLRQETMRCRLLALHRDGQPVRR